jgi:hypothetical protein
MGAPDCTKGKNMTGKPATARKWTSRNMIMITLLAGIMGVIFQIMPDGDLLTFMIISANVAGLVASSKDFDERENQLLWQSYSSAFQGLFLLIYGVFTFKVLLQALHLGGVIIDFLGGHWLGLTAAGMCILLGIAGLRNFRDEK